MALGMPKSLMFPSPNWFQVACMKISSDEWIVYGGPNKSLCVLVPTSFGCSEETKTEFPDYTVHNVIKAHTDKITSVDISPDWPLTRNIIAGSQDGAVKIWEACVDDHSLVIKPTISHDKHIDAKEQVLAVVFSTAQHALTVSDSGNVAKWDVRSNYLRTYKKATLALKPTCVAASPHRPLHLAVGTKQAVIVILDFTDSLKTLFKVRAYNDEILSLSWCPQFEVSIPNSGITDVHKQKVSQTKKDKKKAQQDPEEKVEVKEQVEDNPNVTADTSQLSDISDIEVIEEDLFDMYKDHSAHEFGHKKYVPEDIVVKVKADKEKEEFLSECNKLKSDILKLNEETTIESLVDALDKASVNEDLSKEVVNKPDEDEEYQKDESSTDLQSAESKYQHLLASVSKNGTVQIWSQTGTQVSSCKLKNRAASKQKLSNFSTLLWYSADLIIASDTRNYVMKINPCGINEKGIMPVTELYCAHRRQPYCLVSSRPQVQTSPGTDWPLWSVAQDRNMVRYSFKTGQTKLFCSLGGFVYTIASCPYDASRFAVSGGDGSIRIGTEEQLTGYWRDLQGVLLTCAWHPTNEGIVAFGTAEARVGIVRTNETGERSTRVFKSALTAGVYCISWAPNGLYAVAGGRLVLYNCETGIAKPINISIDGREWKIATAFSSKHGLLISSTEGALALVTGNEPHTLVAAAVPFTKLVHQTRWHPEQVSSSNELSTHSNLLAISAHVRYIVVLQLTKQENGEYKFVHVKRLEGHTNKVFTIQWSPHEEGRLLSTGSDNTVRIWSVLDGVCTHVFDRHRESVLTATWVNDPARGTHIISGGGDFSLLVWDYKEYPIEKYIVKPEQAVSTQQPKKKCIKSKRIYGRKIQVENGELKIEFAKRRAKRRLLLPNFHIEATSTEVNGCRKLFNKYLTENGKEATAETSDKNTSYIKFFGTNKEFEEIIQFEQKQHEQAWNHDSWILLSMLRGYIGDMMKYAIDKNIYAPFLLALAPCVSNKFWLEYVRLYAQHANKMAMEHKQNNILDNRAFGGAVFVSTCFRLAAHEVTEAIELLKSHRLFAEIVVMLRCRHRMDLLDKVLADWALSSFDEGQYTLGASVYLVLKDLPSAVKCLVKHDTVQSLRLAVEIARESGQAALAQCIQEDVERKLTQDVDAQLQVLPTRMEALMKEKQAEKEDENSSEESSDEESGDKENDDKD